MNEKDCTEDIQALSDFLLDYAVALMGVGAHTARVVRNTARIAKCYGYDVDMTIFQRNVTMTVKNSHDSSILRTYVRKLTPMALNLKIISKLSALSWDAYDDCLSLNKVKAIYSDIMTEAHPSRLFVLFAASFGNTAFCRLFGGDIYAMAVVFAATFIGFFIRQELMKRHVDHRIVFFVSAFIASFIASLGVHFNIGSTQEVAIAVSVLYLIPGVPLINSMIDIIEGHVLIGLSRAINAGIFITCITIGLYMTLILSGIGTNL